MRRILISDDSCVGVRLLENNLMYFVTFYGLGFTINLEDYSVINKVITKQNNLCGFVKNKEVFSKYDCDEKLIYEGDFNGII